MPTKHSPTHGPLSCDSGTESERHYLDKAARKQHANNIFLKKAHSSMESMCTVFDPANKN